MLVHSCREIFPCTFDKMMFLFSFFFAAMRPQSPRVHHRRGLLRRHRQVERFGLTAGCGRHYGSEFDSLTAYGNAFDSSLAIMAARLTVLIVCVAIKKRDKPNYGGVVRLATSRRHWQDLLVLCSKVALFPWLVKACFRRSRP